MIFGLCVVIDVEILKDVAGEVSMVVVVVGRYLIDRSSVSITSKRSFSGLVDKLPFPSLEVKFVHV